MKKSLHCISFIITTSIFANQIADSEKLIFPEYVTAINGKVIDITELAKQKTVVVVTLKATWCPVCQVQLERIREDLSEMAVCNLTFLVLAPGPAEELEQIQVRIGFPFPFIADTNLEIAKSLGLILRKNEIIPSILVLDKNRQISWMQKGRNAFYFGDPELMDALNCEGWI